MLLSPIQSAMEEDGTDAASAQERDTETTSPAPRSASQMTSKTGDGSSKHEVLLHAFWQLSSITLNMGN
jgi:hypothetical protein